MNVDVRGGADVHVGMNVDEDEDVHVFVHVFLMCTGV